MSAQVYVDWLGLLVESLSAATGATDDTCEAHARVILERLQRQHGGTEVYVPVLQRPPVTADQVDKDRAARGVSLDRACQRAGISRRTYYRLRQQAALEPSGVTAEQGGV